MMLGLFKNALGIFVLEYRKGMDKPVFVVASLVLAVLFITAIYTASTGWIDTIIEDFTNEISSQGVQESGDK